MTTSRIGRVSHSPFHKSWVATTVAVDFGFLAFNPLYQFPNVDWVGFAFGVSDLLLYNSTHDLGSWIWLWIKEDSFGRI
jgi:hypothetical protein